MIHNLSFFSIPVMLNHDYCDANSAQWMMNQYHFIMIYATLTELSKWIIIQ